MMRCSSLNALMAKITIQDTHVRDTPEFLKCQYGKCGRTFKPYRKWQEYHSKPCRDAAYKERYKDRQLKALQGRFVALERRVADLEKSLEKLLTPML